MHEVQTGYLYPTRSSELPIIHDRRKHLFKKIAGIESESEDAAAFEMNPLQFVTMGVLYQINIYYTIHLIDVLLKSNGLLVFAVYIIIELLVCMPLLVLFLFLSSYSRKGYLKFWDCLPMFSGIGYSMLLCRFTYAVFQVFFSALAFNLMVDYMSNPTLYNDVERCKYDTMNVCYRMHSNKPINVTCPHTFSDRPPNETIYMATQFYYRFEILGFNRYRTEWHFRYPYIIATALIWFTVFIISVFGIQRIGKATFYLQCIMNVTSVYAIISVLVFSRDPTVPRESESERYGIEFWIEILIHSTDMIVLTDMIHMGTLKPSSLSPMQAGLFIGVVKVTYFALVMLYTQRCIHSVLGHYKFLDTRCLLMFGHDIVLAFLPDVLYRVRFGTLTVLLWYVAVFFTNVNILIYTIMGIVSAITERFTSLTKYRILLNLGICTSGFMGGIFFCSSLSLNAIYTYWHYGDVYYTSMIFMTLNLALMFVYSVKRIVEDYTFTYGKPPANFFVIAWQTTPIIAMFTFIFMLYQFKEAVEETFANRESMLWSYLHCTIIILPIFTQLLAKCFKHVKYRTLKTVTKPDDSWGPYDQFKRRARRFFYPQRDVRYRTNTLGCEHRCLGNSEKYYVEIKKQAFKLNVLMRSIAKSRSTSTAGRD